MRTWFRFENSAVANDDAVDLFIFGEIGSIDFFGDPTGVSAASLVEQLAALPASTKTIRVHINSPGGDAFDGVTIANALRAQRAERGRSVEVSIEGLAASAASIVSCAGAPIRIADNALMMIHDPSGLTVGTAAEHRTMADALDRVRDAIVATYRWVSPQPEDKLREYMAAGTWFDADEAIAAGLATEKITGDGNVTAAFDARVVAKLRAPDRFAARVQALTRREAPPPVIAGAADVLTAVVAAGLDAAFAKELVRAGLTIDQVNARITAAKDERAQRATRTAAIRAACKMARLPQFADGYVASGMSVADVKRHLTDITAEMDRAHIDAGLPPEARGHSSLNADAIYRSRQPQRVSQ